MVVCVELMLREWHGYCWCTWCRVLPAYVLGWWVSNMVRVWWHSVRVCGWVLECVRARMNVKRVKSGVRMGVRK